MRALHHRHAYVGLMAVVALGLDLTGHAHAQTKPKVHIVVIEAMQFSPQKLEVKVGDTIVWKNKDPFPHTVTAEDRSFDSGEIAENRTWKLKTRKMGAASYFCKLHSTMKGSLVVK